ncbi:mutator type transposase [Tanacetum coccineum]
MVVCEWHLRTYEEDVDEEHAYRDYPNNFSLKIHHGGYLSDYPNRRYKDGTCNYFDQVDVDLFSIVDLKDMLEILGYKNRNGIQYQYKIPYSNLDFGLKELRNDQDERTPKKSSIDLVKDITPMKSNRLPLLLMADDVGNDETRNENYVEMENDEDSDIAKDIYNVEWGGCSKGNNENLVEQIVAESYDLDDFDSASERVTNNKIYMANAKASMKVLGDYTEQYALLRDYVLELHMTNPDTTVKLDVERYQLLTVVGVDENYETYPLAYAVVEVKTLNSWSWFLTCLGDDLDLTRDSNLTFMSDKQKGLIPAIAQVFLCVEHRFCLRHIHENMKLQFKGYLYKELLWNCASATSMPYFENK